MSGPDLDVLREAADRAVKQIEQVPGVSDADTSLQLSIYMMAAQTLWDLIPERLVLYNVVDNSVIESRRTAAQLEGARERIATVAKRIQDGEFDPTPGYHCRNCLYQWLCPATEQDVALPSPAVKLET